MKNKTTAIILSILVGGLGVDRFYLGYAGIGVLKLLTAGCFGILYIIDIVNICTGRLKPADGSDYAAEGVAAPSSSPAAGLDELERLASLHQQGILSDEEYAKAKADALNRV